MKKTFPLHATGKDDARVRDKIRHEVSKYVRRERKKELPEGYDRWEFNCRAGASAATAEARSLPEIASLVDRVAETGAAEIYLEIIAVPAHRVFRNQASAPGA